MPTTPNGVWSPDDSDDWDLVTDLAAMAVSIDNAFGTPPASFLGTEAERAALAAPKLRNGVTFRTTDTNITYHRSAGAWRIAPGTLLGSFETTGTGNISGASGTVVGGVVVSSVAVPVGQRVKATAYYSQYNTSGSANSNFTLLHMRNNASPVSYADYDKRVGARGWSSISNGVHDSVSPMCMITATVNAPVSAAVYLASQTTAVYGPDFFTLVLEAA